MFPNMNKEYIDYILVNLPIVILSLTLHEIAHGYTAYRLGDLTAKKDGRLSLNPLRHIDPIGLIILVIFHFGWAKPVMINPNNLKDPKKDMAIISLAGPMTNFALSILFFIPLFALGVTNPLQVSSDSGYLILYLKMGFIMNISLAVFNILPFPPLDGSKVFGSLLPDRIYYKTVMFAPRIGIGILLLLAVTGLLSYIIVPMMVSVTLLYYTIAYFFTGLFK